VHADCESGDACRNGQCFTPKESDPEYGEVHGGAEPVAEPVPPVNEGASGADISGPRAVCGAESRIFFDFNVSAVRDDSRAELARIAACLKENASARLVLQGHTDERGATEYNLALGERRSLAVRLYLKNMGADPERLRLVSLGEERPLDDGHDEAAYARNRRVEILPAP
jgi:peptidoglycan-associated lipoprotein